MVKKQGLRILGFVVFLLNLPINAKPIPEKHFTIGVCTHFSQGKGVVHLNLESIRKAGVTAIRDEATWEAIEPVKGKLRIPERIDQYVRHATAMNLEILMILDYANRHYDDGDRPRSPAAIAAFCDYAACLAEHFGSAIRLYEVWNEWDIGIGMREPYRQGGSAEDYVNLLKPVYARMKAIDPELTIMAGACTSGGVHKGWLDGIVEHGALDYCDAISIHAYNYGKRFPLRLPEACMQWIQAIQAKLRQANQGHAVPFYVTEMGWPTQTGKRGTEPQLSASYLARLYLLARTSPSFRGLWWYDFQDDGWNPEHNENNFGIVRPDLTPKPHYHVLTDIAPLVTQGSFNRTVTVADPNLRLLSFTLEDTDAWALWSTDDQERQVVLQAEDSAPPLTIRQLGYQSYQQPWGWRDWTKRGDYQPQQLSLVVNHRPVLIHGDLKEVTVTQTIPRPRGSEYEHHR